MENILLFGLIELRTTCDNCGKAYGIADWPYCPHESTGGVVHMGEEPMEAYVDHNITAEPEGKLITTRGERRRIMDENALEYRRKPPKPGARLFSI